MFNDKLLCNISMDFVFLASILKWNHSTTKNVIIQFIDGWNHNQTDDSHVHGLKYIFRKGI